MTLEELEKLLKNGEGQNLEFKARSSFSDSKLFDYCAALANEKGGFLIFGVNNQGVVVGTKIFEGSLQKYSNLILDAIGIKVNAIELFHMNGRVVVFEVPSRSKGRPVKSCGDYSYPMRAGESLVEMDQETLRVIFIEIDDDFSAKSVPNFFVKDLDQEAISNMRKILELQGTKYSNQSDEQMLRGLELLTDEGLNYAALILLGRKEFIDKILPCSEIIFEWRGDSNKIAHDFRKEWRDSFLKTFDDMWKTINDRNMRIPFQEGLIQKEVLAFNELAIREAILNGIAHRDYLIASSSVFIKADPNNFLVVSPGGFLPGITSENVLEKQAWRNRRIAEVFQKLHLVERSGQGMNQIFETTIREGKGLPDLSASDNYQVSLKIPAQVKDKKFILFLEKIVNEKQIVLNFDEIYELEILRDKKIGSNLRFKDHFLELGIIEKFGNTSGTKYILSHNYYKYEDRPGIYTRIRGIDREKKKELILNHIIRESAGRRKDFIDAFPELKVSDISNILQELKADNKIEREGNERSGSWKIKEKLN